MREEVTNKRRLFVFSMFVRLSWLMNQTSLELLAPTGHDIVERVWAQKVNVLSGDTNEQ